MYALTEKAFSVVGVTPDTFPNLSRLVEFAAAKPGFPADAYADKKRFERQWSAVVSAVGAFLGSGCPDSYLAGAVLPDSLRHLERRPAVAALILKHIPLAHETTVQP